MHIGDVNDKHSYAFPHPPDVQPWDTQYAMLGEFGGMKFGVPGKEWKPRSCMSQAAITTPLEMANAYITMAQDLQQRVGHLSASVYTQTTDCEKASYENFVLVVFKWYCKIAKSIITCLESKEYMEVRNALHVLTGIIDVFPVMSKLSTRRAQAVHSTPTGLRNLG